MFRPWSAEQSVSLPYLPQMRRRLTILHFQPVCPPVRLPTNWQLELPCLVAHALHNLCCAERCTLPRFVFVSASFSASHGRRATLLTMVKCCTSILERRGNVAGKSVLIQRRATVSQLHYHGSRYTGQVTKLPCAVSRFRTISWRKKCFCDPNPPKIINRQFLFG